MASVQEVIASLDLEKIKGSRAACERMLSILKKQLETKQAKTGADPGTLQVSRRSSMRL